MATGFICAGGVLAHAGFDARECPDFAAEIAAYEFHFGEIRAVGEDVAREAHIPTGCVSCNVYHSDGRPMYEAEVPA